MIRRMVPAVAVLLLLVQGRAAGVDFIRGDANSDRQVTFSDAHFLLNFLFRGGAYPECLKSTDVDGDGKINLTDGILVPQYLLGAASSPAAPFPSPGPDPTGSELECESYGSGSPLEDPAAKMEILNADAPGGAEGGATIRIAVSNGAPIGGYFGKIAVAPGLISGIVCEPVDISGTFKKSGFRLAEAQPSTSPTTVSFGVLFSLMRPASIPAGEGVAVMEIYVCLEPGTPAGDYPLTLAEAELVDDASGRAVPPARVDGVLHVLAAVEASAESCTAEPDCPEQPIDPDDPVDPPDPPTPGSMDVDAVYELGSVHAQPGATAVVPFNIRATMDVEGADPLEVQGFMFSVDFDEEVLEGVQVVPVFEKPNGTEYGFSVYEFNNDNNTPGSGGIDEGFVVGGAVFELHEPGNNLPGDAESPVLSLEFLVRPETQASSTEIRFLDGGHLPDAPPLYNRLTVFGESYLPEAFNSFVFMNGYVEIMPDIVAFVRGDSNLDEKVDISDAVETLGYLFLGSAQPGCFDAADSNDDGVLVISDPVYTLMYLFTGGSPPPAPFPAVGVDPTEDPMGCLTRG